MLDDECHDDPTIPGDAILWRRIHPDHWVQDPVTGQWRLSTAAFENTTGTDRMSVILPSPGRDPSSAVAGYPGRGLAAFMAQVARDANQRVCRSPLPDESEHADVAGKKSGSVKRALSLHSTVVIIPATDH